MSNVLCQYCGFPGTFFIKWNDTVLKVTDPFIRITSNRGELALYAHEKCHKVNNAQVNLIVGHDSRS